MPMTSTGGQSSLPNHESVNINNRSCKEETPDPVQGHRTGEIPKWIKGCLLRNGPGMLEVGDDKYNHWFDGLGLVQKFAIENGEATYRNKFVRSESFKKNMAANRIVVSEFGTAAHPDPCATLFDRFKSKFTTQDMTDNTNINVLKIGDQFYASTETNFIQRIDIETLDTKERFWFHQMEHELKYYSILSWSAKSWPTTIIKLLLDILYNCSRKCLSESKSKSDIRPKSVSPVPSRLLKYLLRACNALRLDEQESLSDFMAVNTATAHAHYESDGTTYNLGNSYNGWPSYNFIRFPSSTNNEGVKNKSLEDASVVCKISASRALYPSYYHSFGVSENYLIFVEQSLNINIPKLIWNSGSSSFAQSLYWDDKQLAQFHVVNKSTGQQVPIKFTANPFMVFHHANAFEENGHLVVDLCAYEDGGAIVNSLFIDELKKNDLSIWQKSYGQVRRYVLPLQKSLDNNGNIAPNENLVTLTGSAAIAYKQKDGSILCHPEVLSKGLDTMEMPQVNYASYNAKKYGFLYGIGKPTGQLDSGLIKLNVTDKSFEFWSESGKTPTEPIFVPRPVAQDEDDGVLICSLLHHDVENKVTLLVLDARNFHELARVEFEAKSAVTNSFHGPYVPLAENRQ